MQHERQQVKITDIRELNSQVRRFRLSSASEDKILAPFHPGQYINLFYEIDDTKTCRPYSIASSPRERDKGYYDLYIHGGGSFTASWLFDHGQVGKIMEASLPVGDFCLIPGGDRKKIIGISGGMSITPLRSMALAVADGSLDADLTLFCGWNTYEETLFYQELTEIARTYPHIHTVFLLAKEKRAGFETGYVSREMICRYTSLEDAVFFACGPREMYDTLNRELAPLRISPNCYHQEVPGEVKYGFLGTESIVPQCVYTLRIHRSGKERSVLLQSNETVLVAMERAGIVAEARCRSGHCGYCNARLVSGKVFIPAYWKEQEKEEGDGFFHPCCSFPLSDLEIDLPREARQG